MMADPAPHQFADVAEIYDSLMSVVPYRQWVDYVEQLWTRYGCRPERVLDLACGTGNVTIELAHRGYRATGVDIAAPMVAIARRKAPEIAFYEQDARALDLPERFDACVCLFDSLNYVLELEGLRAAFAGVRRHFRPTTDDRGPWTVDRGPGTNDHGLRSTVHGPATGVGPGDGVPGGTPLLVFDLNAIHALEQGMFTQTGQGDDDRVSYVWQSHWDAARRLCRVEMQFQVQEELGPRFFNETHWQRGYTVAEVTDALLEAGLQPVAVLDAFTFRPPRARSDRIYFVASP